MVSTVYGLRATGVPAVLSGGGPIYSRRIFRTREEAEADIEAFKAKCCKSEGLSSLYDLMPGTVEVRVTEYELVEEPKHA